MDSNHWDLGIDTERPIALISSRNHCETWISTQRLSIDCKSLFISQPNFHLLAECCWRVWLIYAITKIPVVYPLRQKEVCKIEWDEVDGAVKSFSCTMWYEYSQPCYPNALGTCKHVQVRVGLNPSFDTLRWERFLGWTDLDELVTLLHYNVSPFPWDIGMSRSDVAMNPFNFLLKINGQSILFISILGID